MSSVRPTKEIKFSHLFLYSYCYGFQDKTSKVSLILYNYPEFFLNILREQSILFRTVSIPNSLWVPFIHYIRFVLWFFPRGFLLQCPWCHLKFWLFWLHLWWIERRSVHGSVYNLLLAEAFRVPLHPRGFSKHVTDSIVPLASNVFHAQLISRENTFDYWDNCRAFNVWYFAKTQKCLVCFQGLYPAKAKGKLFVVEAVGIVITHSLVNVALDFL